MTRCRSTGFVRCRWSGFDRRLQRASRRLRREATGTGTGAYFAALAGRRSGSIVDGAKQTRAPAVPLAGALTPFESESRALREANATLRRMNERYEDDAKRIAHAIHNDAGTAPGLRRDRARARRARRAGAQERAAPRRRPARRDPPRAAAALARAAAAAARSARTAARATLSRRRRVGAVGDRRARRRRVGGACPRRRWRTRSTRWCRKRSTTWSSTPARARLP